MKRLIAVMSVGLALCRCVAQAPGSNDATLNPGDLGFGVGDPTPAIGPGYVLGGAVECMALDGNGRTIWGGSVLYSPSSMVGFVERRNADGSLDGTFHVTTYLTGTVNAVAVQPDGKVIIGGSFVPFQQASAYNLARFNSDGTFDGTFTTGTGPSGIVRAIVVQPDGKILVGGEFQSYGSTSVQNLVRLNANGTRDLGWTTPSGVNGAVHAITLLGDGSMFIGGAFTTIGGVSRPRVARLGSSGALIAGFYVNTGPNALVRTLAVQTNGSLLLGGDFTSVNGTSCGRIIRLLSTGAVDGSFAPASGFNNSVRSLSLRADGSILAGGTFTTFDGSSRTRLAVIASNGTLDPGFDAGSGPSYDVNGAVTLPSGKVLVVGGFWSCGGVTASRNIRLNANGSPDNTYSYNGVNGTLETVVVQSDGRILIGGNYTTINGLGAGGVSRIFVNGARDPSFVAGISGMSFTDAAALYMNQILLQPDGRILVAGGLWGWNNDTHVGSGLIRIEVNGQVDTTFHAGVDPYYEARGISLQTDGKIIAATNYYMGHNNPATYSSLLKRYNTDGSTDGGFTSGSTASGLIERTAVLDDGRIMVIGNFTNYAATGRDRILRLNTDGTIDATFSYSSGFAGGDPHYVYVQPDGKCIVSGSFTSYDGHAANGLLRLALDGSYDDTFVPNAPGGGPLTRGYDGKLVLGARYRLNDDGSTDPTFNAGSGFSNAFGPTVPKATAVSHGGIIAVGDFISFNGIGRNRIARVVGTPYVDMALPARVLLEGPFVSATNLMNDGLRAAGLIPVQEPFTSLGFTHVLEPSIPTVSASVFNPIVPVFGSIVDWVMLELRSSTDPSLVLQTRTGLLQRDGDIVSTDGVSSLVFNHPLGSYYVSVRSRNHLGVMTAAPVALSTSNALLNFSLPTTSTYGTQAQKTSGSRVVLWAGDVGHDGTLQYSGSGNDRDPILVKVGSTTPNGNAIGYFSEDVNMDGSVKYTGAANDRDPILINVGSTTPNNVRVEQLP